MAVIQKLILHVFTKAVDGIINHHHLHDNHHDDVSHLHKDHHDDNHDDQVEDDLFLDRVVAVGRGSRRLPNPGLLLFDDVDDNDDDDDNDNDDDDNDEGDDDDSYDVVGDDGQKGSKKVARMVCYHHFNYIHQHKQKG